MADKVELTDTKLDNELLREFRVNLVPTNSNKTLKEINVRGDDGKVKRVIVEVNNPNKNIVK